MNVAGVAERGHGAAQSVSFVGREFRRRDRNLHRLFLKQRHSKRAFEHVFQFVRRSMGGGRRGVVFLLDPVAAAQVWMHHIALDRPRPHDRHFDDEVVKTLRLQARQHRHLRTAFDLEHAD